MSSRHLNSGFLSAPLPTINSFFHILNKKNCFHLSPFSRIVMPHSTPALSSVPGAPGISFFTPKQATIPGTARTTTNVPKLFQPWTVKGHTFQNRIILSPMVTLSATDGHATPFHAVHYGGIALNGPGFLVVEATGITAEGRGYVEDLGIWKDSQIEPLRKITEFAHSQGQKIFLQLYHTGRKSGLVASWVGPHRLTQATPEQGGWADKTVAPSAIRYNDNISVPHDLTTEEVKEHVNHYRDAAARAIKAGFDGVEIHAAHGYLIHQFLSGVTNKRTDQYGGSFENRIRFLLEIADAIRTVVPKDSPLLVRISATDGLEDHPELGSESWTVPQSAQLAKELVKHDVDILDVSGYALHPAQVIKSSGAPAYQAAFAKEIKAAVGDTLIVGAVGGISSAAIASELLEDGLDYVSVGREFLKNPALVYAWGKELDVDVQLAHQRGWPFGQITYKV